MADKFDNTLFEEQEYDESLFEDEPTPAVPAQPEISPLESGFGGVKAGATLGFRDELAGVAGAAGHGVGELMEGRLPELQALQETYREARGSERSKMKAEEEAHPGLYLTGELAGGMAIPGLGAKNLAKLDKLKKLEKTLKSKKALEAASKVKKAEKLKAGAKLTGAGAATGLGLSETELLDGDPDQLKQALTDVAVGGATGLAAPAAMQKVGKGLKKLADSDSMRKAAEKTILATYRPPKKVLQKELLAGDKDDYKGVGRVLLGKVRDPETGKDVPISQFASSPEEMVKRIGMAMDQNRQKIQKPFDVAQERINQNTQLIRLNAVKQGIKDPDSELVNQILAKTFSQLDDITKQYGGKEPARRVAERTLEFINRNEKVLKSYNLGELTDLKTKLGKQLSSNEWAKAIEEGTLKAEDKEVIKNIYFLVKKRVEDLADSVSKPGEKLGQQIKDLNKEYSNLLDAKLVGEFDMVRAAKGPSLGYKDFILPGLIGMHTGPGAVIAGAALYGIEKNTGRKIGDLAQMASAKGLDSLAKKVERAKTPRAMALAKQIKDIAGKPVAERAGVLTQLLKDNEELTGVQIKEPSVDSNFDKFVSRPSNIATTGDEQLADIHQRLRDKYGDEHVHVKLLTDILKSDNKDFKRRKKIMLSTDRSFREMVDSVYEGEE